MYALRQVTQFLPMLEKVCKKRNKKLRLIRLKNWDNIRHPQDNFIRLNFFFILIRI